MAIQPAFPFFSVSPGVITHCHVGVTNPAFADTILGPEDFVPYVSSPASGRQATLTINAWRQVRCDAAYVAPLPSSLPKPTFSVLFTCVLTPKLKVIDLLKQLQVPVAADGFVTDINAARQLLLISAPSYKLQMLSSIVPVANATTASSDGSPTRVAA